MWRQYLSYRIILKIKWMPGKHVVSITWILTPMSIYRSQCWWLTATSSPKSSSHPWLPSLLFTSCINSLSPIDFKFQGHLTFIILSSSTWCKAAFSLTWVLYSSQQSPCNSLSKSSHVTPCFRAKSKLLTVRHGVTLPLPLFILSLFPSTVVQRDWLPYFSEMYQTLSSLRDCVSSVLPVRLLDFQKTDSF